jgi:drug/metabolite transporter (DMT)-like permease
MEKINWGRVILGGFLSGAVLISLAKVSTAFGRTQVQAETHGPAALFFLLLGMVMTASYAAFRPRFGAGAKTAALAGFSLWLTGICLSLIGLALKTLAMGEPYPLPSGPLLLCIYLIVIVASTGIGASLYKGQTV